ncbi:HlyD family efflux transporter periplasmic adaptor subunit [Tabrizicola sp.]|uniref:HlyD family efflux transporter periplasmic adaptor subunit n=1 Tax=Tabrizicola sp. TaxID=2005166 RepID=UPI003D2C723F
MTVMDYEDELVGRSRGPSYVIWAIAASLVLFLLWAALAWVDEIVRAPGQIVSSSRPQIIQNLEGGILAELNVAEGDIVEEGQILARLYGTQYQATVDELDDEIAALDIRRLRLEAEMLGQPDFEIPIEIEERVPAIAASERALLAARLTEFEARVGGAKAVAEQTAKELDLIQRMYDREIAPLIELTRAKKAHSDAQNKLSEAVTTTEKDRATEYSKTQGDLASLRQKRRLSQDQLSRTTLLAPMRGVVNKLSVTTIGGVVRPGEEILQIIPLDEDLYVEAKVKPRDIASVQMGQEAVIKLSAYDFTIFGSLKGRVTFVSADTFKDEYARNPDAEAHYKVTLAADQTQFTERQKSLEIRPGMQAEVELQTGGKTILTYLTKPLYKANEALRER